MGRKYRTEGRIAVGGKVFEGEFEVGNDFYNSNYKFFEGLVRSKDIIVIEKPIVEKEEKVVEEVKAPEEPVVVEEIKPINKKTSKKKKK